MKNYITGLWKSKNADIIKYTIGTALIISTLFIFLVHHDISNAPVYIYSQF